MRWGRLFVATSLVAGSVAGVTAVTAEPGHAVAPPEMRIGDVSIIEGDAGTEVINLPVDLDHAAGQKVTVQYTIGNGSATANEDFGPRTAKLTFSATAVHMNLSVYVFGDLKVEQDETVAVHLFNSVNATIDDGDATLTIQNDDGDGNVGLQASIGEVVVTRSESGVHKAQIPVTLSRPAPGPVRLRFTMSCGMLDGFNVQAPAGNLAFQTNQQVKYVTFTVPNDVNDDADGAVLRLINTLTVLSGPVTLDQDTGETWIVDPDDSEPERTVIRQSVRGDGEAPAGPQHTCSAPLGSQQPSISANGRYVAFMSYAKLVPEDTNTLSDVYVHDNYTGDTERVSVGNGGYQATKKPPFASGSDWNASDATISPDGRYVAFLAVRPLAPDATTWWNLYVRDRVTQTTRLIDTSTIGQTSFSADNRYLVFDTESKLAADDVDPPTDPTNAHPWGGMDVFRLDLTSGATELVSKSYDGVASAWGRRPSISANGRYVSFVSDGPGIVPNDTNWCTDQFVRDMDTGVTQQVDVTNSGARAVWTGPSADGCSAWPSGLVLSANGRYAAFASAAWNLVPGATAPPTGPWNESYVYVRDLVNQTTEFIGPQTPVGATPYPIGGRPTVNGISGDGRFVSYTTGYNQSRVITTYLYDRSNGEVDVVGTLPNGVMPNDDTTATNRNVGAISADGHYIAFESEATNLVPNDLNNAPDVFRQRIG